MAWSTERPGQDVYRKTHQNIGKYGGSLGKPYIHPDVPMYVPNDGECCVRIVDPLELMQLQIYFFDVHFHRNVGFQNDYFLCRKRHNLGPCAICEQVTDDLWQTDKDAAKALLPDMRRLMWVIDLKKPQEAGILKLWSCPRSLSDEILAQSRDPELDVIQEVSDPFTGVPVYFMRTGKGLTTKYSGVKLGTNPMPLDEALSDQRFNFMDILIQPSYEEVYSSFHMTDMPAEANPELPPVEAYQDTDGAPSAHEVGAAAAAQAAPAPTQQAPAVGIPEIHNDPNLDYSDLNNIQPENIECFRIYFDQYEECAVCVDRDACQLPWPPKKVKKAKPKAMPAKKAKPAPSRPTPPATGASPQRPSPARPTHPGTAARAQTPSSRPPTGGQGPAAAGAPDNNAQILSAQEKLRAEIAKRKAQS